MNDQDDDSQSLEKRIQNAKAQMELAQDESKQKNTLSDESQGSRAGSEFLASVFAGALLGYGFDWTFMTKPWGMIIMMIMGFVAGVLRANASMKKKR